MRQRRQREVAKENEFYMELLQQGLPPRPDPPPAAPTVAIISTLPDKSSRGSFLIKIICNLNLILKQWCV